MTELRRMNKADLKILERLFAAEIEGHLPVQLKSKRLPALQEQGLIEPMTRNFGRDRFGAITVTGWALTHAGRIAYCKTC